MTTPSRVTWHREDVDCETGLIFASGSVTVRRMQPIAGWTLRKVAMGSSQHFRTSTDFPAMSEAHMAPAGPSPSPAPPSGTRARPPSTPSRWPRRSATDGSRSLEAGASNGHYHPEAVQVLASTGGEQLTC